MRRSIVRFAACGLFLSSLAACFTGRPFPSAYRKAKLDAGIEKSVKIDGYSFRYWDKGAGPALLLLHGLGGSMYDWRFLYDDLAAAGYRVIALDALGAGYTDKPSDGDYTVPTYGERVVKLMDRLGIARAHIAGNSYGGGVGLYLALRHPQRVDRLVLLNAASIPQELPWYVDFLRIPILSDIAVFLVENAPKLPMARIGLNEVYYDNSKIRGQDVDEYAHEYGFSGTLRSLVRCARQVDVRLAFRYADEYHKIRRPTLILWGDRDEITPLWVAIALQHHMPGARLHIFKDCGHVPHMEYPKETLRLMLDFLRTPEVRSEGGAPGGTPKR